MAEIDFRAVKRSDLKEVIVLLNQLKEIDVSKINLNIGIAVGYLPKIFSCSAFLKS